MSDTSEETLQSDRTGDKDENLCRDYSRGLCDRKFCKFKHESDAKPLNFCHDFQNFVCPRPFCKFIHCSAEEVDEYKRTGQMSNQIIAEATRKNQLPGVPPICNQFKKGQCRRTFCKYRHITKEQEEVEIAEFVQNTAQKKPNNPIVFNNNNNNNLAEAQLVTLESLGVFRRNGVSFDDYKEDGLPLIKRRFVTQQEPEIICDLMDNSAASRPLFKGYFAGNPPSTMLTRADARSLLLDEENQLLRKEIARLKKQVSDLTATNEFLLDQNAALRVTGKRNGTVNVPAVSITNTPTQVNRTVIASVATVPVSLATVSTCNPGSGNHSVSIAGCPAVSMAPAQILANSQQILVTTNPTTQLAIANSSQAQLAIAQQNLATNLAAAQAQAQQPQLTSQAQQLALATTTQQLTSQAQHMANQQMALASAAAPQLATQTQQMALASNAQAQQLQAIANTNQQLTSQAQQLALASTNQQLNTQAQQLTVTNVPQQLALASTNQQLLAAQQQQNLASEMRRNSQAQAIAMSNAQPQSMVSYPIMTQGINHALAH
ncbi:unnamed protein product [Phyllotreta striolata]|uniref:C3H1-type domain-containing protein n=1 Tax=Phyllotreta striolata TaxID=444603 RepID=A0A9N9XSI1_PHYSR|nr:unnamed protein product [Phyllotreta striolata]